MYRYHKPKKEWLQQIFLEDTLHFSAPSTFDDPCDCKITIEPNAPRIIKMLTIRKLVRLRKPLWRPHQIQNEILRLLLDFEHKAEEGIDSSRVSDTVGILCLTERNNNMHMWQSYAAGHTGVCLIFSMEHDSPPLFPVYKIFYEDELPLYNPFRPDREGQLLESLVTKTKKWKNEEEWKVWEEKGPGYHKFNPDQLIGLIFGANASEGLINKVTEMNEKRNTPLSCYRAQLSGGGQKVSINPM